jgi:membrane protease YdiL (CAAX protease family)
MNLIDHLNVLVFTCLYPIYVFFAYRKAKKDLIENKPGIRIGEYKETIFWLWLLCVITIIIWISNDRMFNVLRLDFSFSWVVLISILLFFITPFLFVLLFRSIRNNDEKRESIKEKLNSVSVNEFLPRSKKEFKWFVFLSITAGICEELLFRGFLIWYFETLTNTFLAIILSSILFGAAHSYQGVKGFIRSGFWGLILALILIWTDSLLIPIFIHIAGDIYSGIIGWLGYGEFMKPKVKKTG